MCNKPSDAATAAPHEHARARVLLQGRRGGSFTHLYMPHDGRGIEFTHEARKLIPKAVLDDIR
eukprot:366492-Chlamydomonas_euryale.AAC.6